MKKGFLWIGDPHITARKPGRRLDDSFLDTTIYKLEQALDIAKENDLIPVITGDLVDIAYEHKVIVPLIKALMGRGAITLVGNHDFKDGSLKNTTLEILSASEVLEPLVTADDIKIFDIESGSGVEKIRICNVPEGSPIPDTLPTDEGVRTILLTHDNIEFDSSKNYPGMVKPKEIPGCELVVNGHMHMAKEPVQQGLTTWFNPGNIVRLSVNLRDHKPSVWAWYPDRDMERYELKHKEHVFDLSGYSADSIEKVEYNESDFARLLGEQAKEALERPQSDKGDFLEETLQATFDRLSPSEATIAIINNLKTQVLEEHPDLM